MTADKTRIEVACALFVKGTLGKVRAAEMAHLSLIDFQRELAARKIESYSSEMLNEDLRSLKMAFGE